MTTSLKTNSVLEGNVVPHDLSLYIGKKTLVELILRAIEDLNARTPEREIGTPNTAFQPAMMLTLLTYCYATGVYGSADIQLGIQHDPMIRYLCARDYPDICGIRSFRRYHRERVTQCLSAVLRQVWELRFCGEDAEPIRSVASIESSVVRRIDVNTTPDFEHEAGKRITRAVRADSMATDL